MKCFPSHDRDEVISNVLSGSKNALELGKSALEVFPVPGLALGAEVLISLIERVEEVRTTQEGLKELSDEISLLAEAIKKTSQKTEEGMKKDSALGDRLRSSPELPDRFIKLRDKINGLKTQADELYKGPLFLRCFHSSRDAETLKKLQRGVTSALNYFNVQCQDAIEQLMKEVLGAVEDLKANNDLEALPHIDANYCAHVNTAKSSFLAGTRIELLGKLVAWAEGHGLADSDVALSSKPICILTGGVGTGKSTIASEFAKRLDTQPRNSYGASFFFDCQVKDLSSTKFFFTTIAHELARAQSAFRQPTAMAARNYLTRGQFQQIGNAGALVQTIIRKVSGGHSAILLVVDAVDECKDLQLVPSLLDILVECVRKAPFPLRIFITSRPDHPGERSILFKHSAYVHKISLDDLPLESVTDDIATFLRDRFSQTAPGKRVLECQDEQVERLAKRAGRSFLFARTAMKTLGSDLEHFEEKLQKMLDSTAQSAVVQPTVRSHQHVARDPLDGLYLMILETVFPSGDMEEGNALRAHVEAVLGCIALLSDHLSLRALEAFMAISPDDSLRVLYKLRAVVLSEDGDADGLFRPMHASFSLFLVDPDRCTNPLYLVNKPREQARLAEGCLNVVMSLGSNVVQPANTAAGQVEMSEDLAKQAKEHTMLPHVRYACLHWGSHLGEAEKTEGLTKVVDKFAAPETMQKWLVALGDLGRLDVAKAALDSAYKWEEPSNPKRGLLDKARQLVDKIEDRPEAVHSFAREIRVDAHNPAVGQPALRKGSDYDRVIPGGYPRDSVAYSPGRENS